MAERVLFIGWDHAARGREERAVEVFNDAVGLFGRLQQAGRIEGFDVVLLESDAGAIGGYMELHGSPDQLAAMQEDAELRRVLIDAELAVDGLCVTRGYANAGIAEQMELYQDALTSLPQRV